jgi:hypothetical protein
MTVVVASTIPAYVMDQPDTYEAWLRTQDELRLATPHDVRFFAALEYDEIRGPEVFEPLLDRLDDAWNFRFDDGEIETKTSNRLRRITIGQNLCSDYAVNIGASHMLFMAADCCPPPDAIVKLLELDWPIVGGEVRTYCLNGPWVTHHPASGLVFDFPVQQQMATAAFVMLNRDLLKRLHWRYDTEMGMTDDPCLQHDALQLGFPTLVRKDCVGVHFPEAIGPIETRGHDMRLKDEDAPVRLVERELAVVTEPTVIEMPTAFEAKRWLMNMALANRGCQAVACVGQDARTVEQLFRSTSDPKIPFTCSGHDRQELTAIAARVPVHCTLGGPVIHGPAACVILPESPFDWDEYADAGARVLIVELSMKSVKVLDLTTPRRYTEIVHCDTPDGPVCLYDKLPQPMPIQPQVSDVTPIRGAVSAHGVVLDDEWDDWR